MKHEYLRELFPNGDLPFPYSEEDYHDFDERDTFSMDMTLIMWLYERLRFFQNEASEVVDFNDTLYMFGKKVLIDGREVTLRECIDRMVEDCATILHALLDEIEEDYGVADAAKDDLFMVLSKVYWAMWW